MRSCTSLVCIINKFEKGYGMMVKNLFLPLTKVIEYDKISISPMLMYGQKDVCVCLKKQLQSLQNLQKREDYVCNS